MVCGQIPGGVKNTAVDITVQAGIVKPVVFLFIWIRNVPHSYFSLMLLSWSHFGFL